MTTYALVCTVEPVGGVCPTGSEAWVDVQTFSPFSELSAGDVASLMAPALLLFCVAWGLKFVRRQLANV